MDGHLLVVQYLVQQGGDVNGKDNEGILNSKTYYIQLIDIFVPFFDNIYSSTYLSI